MRLAQSYHAFGDSAPAKAGNLRVDGSVGRCRLNRVTQARRL